MNPFLSGFLPAITGTAAQALPAGMQGQVQGMALAQQLALQKAQMESEQAYRQNLPAMQALRQKAQQDAFDLGQQKLQRDYDQMANKSTMQDTRLAAAEGRAQENMGYKTVFETMKENNARQSLADMGGMKAPATVDEKIKRKEAAGLELTDGEKAYKRLSMAEAKEKSSFSPRPTTIMDPEDPSQAIVVDSKTGRKIGQSPRLADATKEFAVTKNFETSLAGGVLGRQVIANNTAIAHLDLLEEYVDALTSGNVKRINALKFSIQKEIGIGEVPATIDALTPIIAGEIIKTVAAAGGGVEERADAAKKLTYEFAKGTVKSVIHGQRGLLLGKQGAIEHQYEAVTGKTDFKQKYLIKQPEIKTRPGTMANTEKRFNELKQQGMSDDAAYDALIQESGKALGMK